MVQGPPHFHSCPSKELWTCIECHYGTTGGLEVAADMISNAPSLCLMALALGMDAFSACMGMGMAITKKALVLKTGALIGLFHAVMPLAGMAVGRLLSQHMGSVAGSFGGGLLILIGIQMILSKSRERAQNASSYKTGVGLILFSIGVSIDSFSVGLGMGLSGAQTLVVIFVFGFFSMMLACAGFFIGWRSKRFFGHYGETFGGIILLIFGFKLLFHFHL